MRDVLLSNTVRRGNIIKKLIFTYTAIYKHLLVQRLNASNNNFLQINKNNEKLLPTVASAKPYNLNVYFITKINPI